MNETLKIIITSVTSIITTVITVTIPLYVKNRKLKKEMKYITTGMVVAYFFSFIKPLFDKLELPGVIIKTGDKIFAVTTLTTELELVIPKTLNNYDYNAAKRYLDSYSKGELKIDDVVLFRDIKYKINPRASSAVILIDAPNILESAVSYFKESMRTSDFSISEEFKAITEKELTNFKTEIERMIKNSEFQGKVNITQL